MIERGWDEERGGEKSDREKVDEVRRNVKIEEERERCLVESPPARRLCALTKGRKEGSARARGPCSRGKAPPERWCGCVAARTVCMGTSVTLLHTHTLLAHCGRHCPLVPHATAHGALQAIGVTQMAVGGRWESAGALASPPTGRVSLKLVSQGPSLSLSSPHPLLPPTSPLLPVGMRFRRPKLEATKSSAQRPPALPPHLELVKPVPTLPPPATWGWGRFKARVSAIVSSWLSSLDLLTSQLHRDAPSSTLPAPGSPPGYPVGVLPNEAFFEKVATYEEEYRNVKVFWSIPEFQNPQLWDRGKLCGWEWGIAQGHADCGASRPADERAGIGDLHPRLAQGRS